jgi:hypothetical protein
MTKTQAASLSQHFMHLHLNPPPPFNPDYNPETVKRYEKYATELGRYTNSLPDTMPEDEFRRLTRAKQRVLQKEYDIYVRMGCLPAEELAGLEYCIQCTDRKSGQTGDFLHYGDLIAVSPVFNDLAAFFTWLKNEGLTTAAKPSFGVEKLNCEVAI